MMTPRRFLPALALLALPCIGCVGGPPVDESAPAAPAITTGAIREGVHADPKMIKCGPQTHHYVVQGPDDGDQPDSSGGPDDNPCPGGPVGDPNAVGGAQIQGQ